MSAVHEDYVAPPLEDLGPDPIAAFLRWHAEAGVPEPDAAVLSTTAGRGRVVLVRGPFRFFTNYESAKAREIAADPRVSLTFHWQPVHRQVRVEGVAARLPAAESDAYFAGRPRGSQLSAHASPQSQPISRAELEARLAALEFEGDVPRPDHWGGYGVTPDAIEFWQGRPNRLHDRLRYVRLGDGWEIDRLAP
jgi:pyridoxamine 5'-phosphate oxidase